MSSSHWIQYALVGVAVFASVLYLAVQLFPALARKVQAKLIVALVGSRLAPLQRLGRRLAPKSSSTSCGSCHSCSPK